MENDKLSNGVKEGRKRKIESNQRGSNQRFELDLTMAYKKDCLERKEHLVCYK